MKLQGFGERSGIASSKWSNPTRDRGRWVVRLLWLGAVCSMVGMANFLVFGSLGSDAKDYLLLPCTGAPRCHTRRCS